MLIHYRVADMIKNYNLLTSQLTFSNPAVTLDGDFESLINLKNKCITELYFYRYIEYSITITDHSGSPEVKHSSASKPGFRIQGI